MLSGHADNRGRVQLLDRLQEAFSGLRVMGEFALVGRKIRTLSNHQTLGVKEVAAGASFFNRDTFFISNRFSNQVSDAGSGFACAQEKHSLIGKFAARHTHC